MPFKDLPINRKLMRFVFLICATVLFVTCSTFFTYEFYKFKQTSFEKISTIGKIISNNGTAALAFLDQEDANEILASLKSEPQIVAACFYDQNGDIFSQYTPGQIIPTFPVKPGLAGYHFKSSFLEGFETVKNGSNQLGTLYLKLNLNEIYDRIWIYLIIIILVIIVSFLLVYILSRIIQKNISTPILSLAGTAKIISEKKDYSVRVKKSTNDELGSLTDAFNQMLQEIQDQSEKLMEFNQQLEQKVRERTKKLESANKELEQFAYVAAHDLQEPLRTINNFVGLFVKKYGKTSAESEKYAGFIQNATSRMQNIIKDLLDYSTIKTNQPFHIIDLNEILKKVTAEMNHFIKENKAEIISTRLPVLNGNAIEMKRLFQNLLSNAIKFHKEGVIPQVKIHAEEKETEYLFSFKDNGIGIEKQYLGKLFTIFQRLHTASEYPGTGIGLAICKKVVDLHGGRIWVESDPNKGSTFYFTIAK
jgi:signal transduction histidine kinase